MSFSFATGIAQIYHILLFHLPGLYAARALSISSQQALLSSLITDWKRFSVTSAVLLSSVPILAFAIPHRI